MAPEKDRVWIHIACDKRFKNMVEKRAKAGQRSISQQVRFMLSVADRCLDVPEMDKHIGKLRPSS